ncbi:MAG: nitrate- and nitrite sensing domain-containing protein, partial [Pseudonocardiales bacterium]|nr:nitrate- and nitrite sensing domain-containing protein [Pseudonocardiales bacterium]
MTTTEPTTSWAERVNPRNWTLAWKLVAIGLVPALLALALGVLRISDQAGDAAELGASNRLLEVRTEVAAAGDALRQERDEAARFVAGGRTQDRGVLDIGIGQTDDAVATALATVRELDPADYDATTTTALTQAEEALAQLPALRNDVGAGSTTTTGAVVQRFTGVVARVDALDRALLRQLRTPDVAGLADALTAAADVREQLELQHTVLGAAILAGALTPADVASSQASDTLIATAFSNYRLALTPEQYERYGALGEGSPEFQRRADVRDAIATTQIDRPVLVDPAVWDEAHAALVGTVQAADANLAQELGAASVAAEERASNLAGINSVILMLGLLFGITVAVLIARALIRSLRVLRTSALDVAERRLPLAVESMRSGEAPDVTVDPVPLTSRDEVGQVARAFDAVHGQAVRLAADQAALQTNVSSMFVNLSRRSQALVERQLQLIEQLESNEQDPDQLSNLFQLDHLATRMRRNSENLLVLAGTDLAKRNIAPVPMVDVLRAAVSEIEQYQRIVVQAPPSASIVGRAASDLVHLLAELLDNATNFSPPDSQVVMSTTRTADGAVLVEIADRGVGMIDYELADANQRLGGPSSVDVSASRRMGLFVVGRLGARHGIQVQLSTSSAGGPGAGLTASVTVPAALVPGSEAEQARRDVAAGTGSAFDVPPQRVPAPAAPAAPAGSLSALVSGGDGPATPTPFEQAERPAPVNGSTPALPTRRPGSSLQPEGFGPPRTPDTSVAERARQDQADAERAAAERSEQERAAQERAEQERIEQERADAMSGGPEDGATERPDGPAGADVESVTAAHPVVRPVAERTEQPDAAAPEHRNGAAPYVNGTNGTTGRPAPDALRTPWPGGAPPHGNGTAPRPSPLPQRRPAEQPSAERQGTGSEPIAPPTMPMPAVDRAAATPSAEPAAEATDPSPTTGPAGPAAGIVPPAPELPPARSDADGLFAPAVPADAGARPVPDEGLPAAPVVDAMPPRPTDRGSGFELGETTPIFEEIASAWFRSNRPLPVDWEDEQGSEADAPSAAPAAEPRPAAPQAPAAPTGQAPAAQPPGYPP